MRYLGFVWFFLLAVPMLQVCQPAPPVPLVMVDKAGPAVEMALAVETVETVEAVLKTQNSTQQYSTVLNSTQHQGWLIRIFSIFDVFMVLTAHQGVGHMFSCFNYAHKLCVRHAQLRIAQPRTMPCTTLSEIQLSSTCAAPPVGACPPGRRPLGPRCAQIALRSTKQY